MIWLFDTLTLPSGPAAEELRSGYAFTSHPMNRYKCHDKQATNANTDQLVINSLINSLECQIDLCYAHPTLYKNLGRLV